MRKYKEDLDALLSLEFFGMKLGLSRMQELLKVMGDPHRTFKAIHVAGTNGKGSVSATLASILQAGGKRVGLYTSPHLVNLRERIRVDGAMISEEAVQAFCEEYWGTIKDFNATFFEVMTAMAFDYFRKADVEIAIIETGLGGRLDATNVLERPLATVITSIGLDHRAQLGNTLEEIAREKSGILKTESPAFVNVGPELEPVFLQAAHEVGAPLYFLPQTDRKQFSHFATAYSGGHQRDNLDLALLTLQETNLLPTNDLVTQQGISMAPMIIRGRLENLSIQGEDGSPIELIADVGHNPEAIAAVVATLIKQERRFVVVLGLMQDKELKPVLSELSKISSSLVATQANWKRALPAEDLADAARSYFASIAIVPNVINAVEEAGRRAGQMERGAILLIGSHYTLGEYFANQEKRGIVIAPFS